MTCRERALKRIATHPRILEIFRLEPRVAAILDEVKQVKLEPGYWWYPNYSKYKRALMQYVGWEAEQDELGSEQDYDLIIGTMDDLLPLNCAELFPNGGSPADKSHPCYCEDAAYYRDDASGDRCDDYDNQHNDDGTLR